MRAPIKTHFSAVLLISLCLGGSVTDSANAEQPPNIVLILADDLGYGDLSCYGATKIDTPNIDRLAREGRRFSDAHSPSSVCTPTRYNLMTGRYCWRTWAGSSGVWANDPLIFDPARRMTIASLLKRAGYDTAMVGKWHLGFGRPDGENWNPLLGVDYNKTIKPGPIECGFDTWFGIPHVGQLPHVYIRDHHVVGLDKLDKPIRLVLDPEKSQYATTYDKRPRDAGMSPWLTFENTEPIQYEHEDLAIRLTEEAVEYLDTRSPGADAPFFLYFAHRNPHVPWRPNPRFKGQSEAGDYGDFIGELDWSVGRVLDALDRRGLTDDTLVILSSDNGGMAQYRPMDFARHSGHQLNGPLRGQKTQVYEGGHRVPLLARWPGRVAPSSTSDALLALTDVMATFAELTGQALPNNAGEDSFSFLPHLLDDPANGPTRDTLIHDSYRGVLAVRRGPWKLIPTQNGGGIREDPGARDPHKPAGQLYNLEQDLSESNNLYARHPGIVAELTTLLMRIQRDGRSRPRDRHEKP